MPKALPLEVIRYLKAKVDSGEIAWYDAKMDMLPSRVDVYYDGDRKPMIETTVAGVLLVLYAYDD